MCSIISGQIDGSGPTLDHPIHALDGERLVCAVSGLEQVLVRLHIAAGKKDGKSLVDGFVDHQDVDLPGLGLFDADGVSNPFPGYVLDLEAQDVSGSDTVVDTQGEQQQDL